MSIFDIITLFGGLAMFLYGMRMMGDGLKEGSSGALKKVMEKVTDTPLKAFTLGLIMTAVIQSSKATIVITSGLVGAGIITLHQSLGIIIGANVGTTVTGQIIRLMDLNSSGVSVLQFFNPSTLAPLALIAGMVIIMSKKVKGGDTLGKIIIGFGILFSGLMTMTDAVSTLKESGMIEALFAQLGEKPLIGCLIGAGVAFVLQSASASIGIMQAFSISGLLTFSGVYPVLIGIYLGDCITTAIVCNIGARPDAKRVGIVNILFNICKVALILLGVAVAHKAGFLDNIWGNSIHSGGIANANTIFNLASAILMLPFVGLYERLSHVIIKDDEQPEGKYDEKMEALSPNFLATPALALNGCYEVLMQMYKLAHKNIDRAFDAIVNYDEKRIEKIYRDEDTIDMMADKVSNYLVQISAHITESKHVEILNHYYAVNTEFERLGDHATNIAETATGMHEQGLSFSENAIQELNVVRDLIESVLEYTEEAFRSCDVTAARHIEPLEEVVDDMVNALEQNHLERLREGACSVFAGTSFLNLLSDVERISDICSDVGVATVARTMPEMEHQIHDYVSQLHSGSDASFNKEYQSAHDRYFRLLP